MNCRTLSFLLIAVLLLPACTTLDRDPNYQLTFDCGLGETK